MRIYGLRVAIPIRELESYALKALYKADFYGKIPNWIKLQPHTFKLGGTGHGLALSLSANILEIPTPISVIVTPQNPGENQLCSIGLRIDNLTVLGQGSAALVSLISKVIQKFAAEKLSQYSVTYEDGVYWIDLAKLLAKIGILFGGKVTDFEIVGDELIFSIG